MGLKDGYKQTEIGIIPGDWEVESLGDLTTLLTNGFVGTATRHYTNSDDGILYIQGFNVEENSFNFTGIKRVTKEFHKNNSKSCLREGDLLTIQTGDVGLTTIVPKRLEGSNCHALIISRFKENKAFPKFYSQYFNSFVGRNRLKDIETGTTMKHLNVGDMVTWKLPCPSLPEQQTIAEALSDVDALIISLDQLITKKRNIKQGTMQLLLTGKKRLTGFSGNWKNKTVGEVVSFSGGSQPPLSTFIHKPKPDYIRLIQIRDYKTDEFATYIPESLARKRCSKSDIMIGRYGPPIFQILRGLQGAYNVALLKAIPSVLVDSEFLFYFLKQNALFKVIEALSQRSSGQTGVDMNGLRDYPFPLPTIKEQKAIAHILSDMDTEIEKLEQQRDKYKAVKQGMMQELLTGRIRIVNDEL